MGLRGQQATLLSPRMGEGLYLAVGEGKAIRVGDDLQKDVHGVKNGGESWVLAIVLCDLGGSGSREAEWAKPSICHAEAMGACPLDGKGGAGLLWALDTSAPPGQSPLTSPCLPSLQTRPRWPE